MEYIFAFIRAGDLDSARDFCFKVGQSWRAATLEGFKLYNDDNYLSDSTTNMNNRQAKQQIFKNEGNLNRDIWRLMVQKLIKDVKFKEKWLFDAFFIWKLFLQKKNENLYLRNTLDSMKKLCTPRWLVLWVRWYPCVVTI